MTRHIHIVKVHHLTLSFPTRKNPNPKPVLDDVDFGIRLIAPDLVHQVFCGENESGMQYEELNELIFLICELDALITGLHLVAVAVEGQITQLLKSIGSACRRTAAWSSWRSPNSV